MAIQPRHRKVFGRAMLRLAMLAAMIGRKNGPGR